MQASQPGQPVFTDEIGHRLTPKSATNAFSRLAKKAGISTTRLHDLRHTGVTMMLESVTNPVAVVDIAGHANANANVTLSIYAHVMEGSGRAAVDALGDRVKKAMLDAHRENECVDQIRSSPPALTLS